MERCEYCKSEIKDGADACPKCGAPIVRLSKEEQIKKRQKERYAERQERSKKDKALFKKIAIGFAVFMVVGGIMSFISSNSADSQVYESAKSEIEYQWDVKTMFEQEDAKITKDGKQYIVYGVIYGRKENASYRDSGKRLKIKCTVPYEDDKAGRATCGYDE